MCKYYFFLSPIGFSVVLDLTPNYPGSNLWFNDNAEDAMEEVKVGHASLLPVGKCIKCNLIYQMFVLA